MMTTEGIIPGEAVPTMGQQPEAAPFMAQEAITIAEGQIPHGAITDPVLSKGYQTGLPGQVHATGGRDRGHEGEDSANNSFLTLSIF